MLPPVCCPGMLPKDTKLRSSKYLNNLIEQDHPGIESRTRSMLGFKNFSSAAITIAAVELLHRIHKDQFAVTSQGSIRGDQPPNQEPSCARALEGGAPLPPDPIRLFAPEPSEEGLNDVDDLILGVQHRQQAPFVEGQARVRDIEADHVAYAKIILPGDLQVSVLIHDFGK